jgi:hypothetical protein
MAQRYRWKKVAGEYWYLKVTGEQRVEARKDPEARRMRQLPIKTAQSPMRSE